MKMRGKLDTTLKRKWDYMVSVTTRGRKCRQYCCCFQVLKLKLKNMKLM